MTPWDYLLWGAYGGLAVEAIEFSGAIRRIKDWPWKVAGESPPFVLAISVMIRIGLSLGLTLAAGQAGQIAGPMGAVAVGAAAPLLIEQMAKQVSLTTGRMPHQALRSEDES